jgi:hypothetical protein
MKSLLRFVFVACVAILFSGFTVAQQPVAPPPMPAADGPSLVATMQFIEKKLNELGTVNFAAYLHDNADGTDSTDQVGIEYSNVVADPVACRIAYHRKAVDKSDAKSMEENLSLNLRDVQDLVVMPGEQRLKKINTASGHTTLDARVDPPIFVLVARKVGNQENSFIFFDEEMANRVAKAITHAVELCGGGNQDKF